MNVAGKSLQDIYDAGSKRLEELENAQKNTMSETTESHLDNRNSVEPESLKQLEDKTDDLDTELRTYLNRGLERVEKAMSAESQESERHISRLVESLVLLSKKFSESIGKLRHNAESQLQDLCTDSTQLHQSHSQTAKSHLQHAGAEALGEVRNEGSRAHENIATTLDGSWQSMFEAENEAVDGLVDCYDNDRQAVKKAIEDAKASLHERLDERTLKLEARNSQAQDNIKSTVEHVLEQSDRHAFDIDVRMKEGFSSMLYEMTTSFDDSANRASSELAGLHESSMVDLNMRSQELSREMDSVAEGVTSTARDKSQNLQARGSELITNFTTELSDRLQSSNVFHRDLEEERKREVAQIWNELAALRKKYDERLSKLASQTLDKMRSVCTEAESAITAAQQSCSDDSKSNATAKRESIEKLTKDFLSRVESTKSAALESIAKAAGASADEDIVPPSLREPEKNESESPKEEPKEELKEEPKEEFTEDPKEELKDELTEERKEETNAHSQGEESAESEPASDSESSSSESDDDSAVNPKPATESESPGESRLKRKRRNKQKSSAGEGDK